MSIDFQPLAQADAAQTKPAINFQPLELTGTNEQQASGSIDFQPLADSTQVNEPQSGVSFTPLDTGAPTQPATAKPADSGTDYLGAVGQGIKMSVDPFQVDAKEINKPRSLGETLAETGANIATDIATTAGVGALAGSVFPGVGTAAGVVAGIGLGIYRALGYEHVMSEAKGESFNPARAAVNIAVESLPALRFGKLANFVGQGALQAVQTLSYGGDAADAALSGIIGGALGAVGAHGPATHDEAAAAAVTAMVTNPRMGPKAMEDVVAHLTDNGTRTTLLQQAAENLPKYEPSSTFRKVAADPEFFSNMAKGTPIQDLSDTMSAKELVDVGVSTDAVNSMREDLKAHGATGDSATLTQMARQQVVLAKMEDQATDLARSLLHGTSATGPELFTAAAERLKATSLSMNDLMENQALQNSLNDAVGAEAERMTLQGTKLRDPADNTIFRHLSDQKFVARMSDTRTGLDLEPRFADISVAKNHKNQFVRWAAVETSTLLKKAKKPG